MAEFFASWSLEEEEEEEKEKELLLDAWYGWQAMLKLL